MTRFSTRITRFNLIVVFLAMIVAALGGWMLGSRPPDVPLNRARLAILPFNDPESPEIADFNRALTEAFVIALTNADRENLAVIRPAATGRMLVAGLTPAEIAKRTQAGFVLVGVHREADHVTGCDCSAVNTGSWLLSGESVLGLEGEAGACRPQDMKLCSPECAAAWGIHAFDEPNLCAVP